MVRLAFVVGASALLYVAAVEHVNETMVPPMDNETMPMDMHNHTMEPHMEGADPTMMPTMPPHMEGADPTVPPMEGADPTVPPMEGADPTMMPTMPPHMGGSDPTMVPEPPVNMTKCALPYWQSGFVITGGCAAGNVAHDTMCTAQCAQNFSGAPMGTVKCNDGEYWGSFSGCSRPNSPCTLPNYACTGAGNIQTGYVSSGYNADTCEVDHNSWVTLGCDDGYYATQGSFRDAVCSDGILKKGWAGQVDRLVCEMPMTPPEPCDCGLPGHRSPRAVVRQGRVRESVVDVWNFGTNKNWECWVESRTTQGITVKCACRCSD
eukprot:TRINITY_DN1013_c0_g1_i1.p1 TRINITY_DN1013_c0_g1~~TRINITY_DN1013_c0_g1_i1.p1  ORF type:complete len:320 (-),score=25.79 TRINITY_DN1013_c0_g1_i1:651-1610(-)